MHARVRAGVCLAGALLAMPILGQDGDPLPIGSARAISSPGAYRLVADIEFDSTREVAIVISASGVSLDLNGRQIKGPGGKQGIGIRITGAAGVKVSNGRIADTAFGVVVENSHNVTLMDLEIRGQGLAVTAPPPETAIMIVQSRAVAVERNNISNVGLGVFVRGSQSWGNRIAGNTVTAGTNGVLGICYNPAPGDPKGPRGDLIYNNLISGFGIGIQVSASMANVFRENTIVFRSSAFESINANDLDMENIKTHLQ